MINRHALFWRLFPAYLAVILVSLLAISLYTAASFRKFYLRQTAEDLESNARLVVEVLVEQESFPEPAPIDAACKKIALKTAVRVTVLDLSGNVMGDSSEAPSAMENHANRTEVKAAFSGITGTDTHFSLTVGMKMMYVAVPMRRDGKIAAVVRTSVSIASIENVVREAYMGIAICAIIIALLATAVSLVLSRKIGNPIEDRQRQFVANVSHELRTPITSIKGFAETLLDGAMDDPEDRKRFLDIISKQSQRLIYIVEDLLALSRLEQETRKEGISLGEASLLNVIQNAVQVCDRKAREKNIALEVRCGDHLSARINAPLLEQAIVNLIDNARKFSEQGSTVHVEARREKKETVIHVRDKGIGIKKKHLSRLFERFYRVDKARSRSLGGTGLGLAIVKHIVELHRGRVHVESQPGEGSTFSIYLPQ